MESEKWTLRSQARSFGFAFAGIRKFTRSERHALVHLVSTAVVFAAGCVLGVSAREAIELLIVTGLVWVAEMINTCIEKLADFITTQKHPQLAYVKDVAAGSVLVAAIVACITGLIIFLPKIV